MTNPTAKRLKHEIGTLVALQRFASVRNRMEIEAQIMTKRHELASMRRPRPKIIVAIPWKKRLAQAIGFILWAIGQSYLLDYITRHHHK